MLSEPELIQRQRELLRQVRTTKRVRTNAEQDATKQQERAQQQAKETLTVAMDKAKAAQQQVHAQANAELKSATEQAKSILEQTQNQIPQYFEPVAKALLEQVFPAEDSSKTDPKKVALEDRNHLMAIMEARNRPLSQVFNSAKVTPKQVEPNSLDALKKASSQVQVVVANLVKQKSKASNRSTSVYGCLPMAFLYGVTGMAFWYWSGVSISSLPEHWLDMLSFSFDRGIQYYWSVMLSLSIISILIGLTTWISDMVTGGLAFLFKSMMVVLVIVGLIVGGSVFGLPDNTWILGLLNIALGIVGFILWVSSSTTILENVSSRQLSGSVTFRDRMIYGDLIATIEDLAHAVAAVEFYTERARSEAQQEYDRSATKAQTAYENAILEAQNVVNTTFAAAQKQYDEFVRSLGQPYKQSISQAEQSYTTAWANVPQVAAILSQEPGYSAAGWDDIGWAQWSPATGDTPSVTSMGSLIESGPWDDLTMPALIPFLGGRSLLIKSDGAGRKSVGEAAQSFLLRLLATVPVGKLRFTFIDPVGLGQNVAPFMHLADYDDALVTARAWTEHLHIEQRLADLTEHMENVIQKYLRNEYADIEAYNSKAGEVAEAYRVLVVYDFPANFSERAAQRLISILQNGPRCGVYALVHVDSSKPLPYGFNLGDLERNATVIARQEGRFVWANTHENKEESFADCELTLDAPPPPELFNRIVNTVGQVAKDLSRVEVPFTRIAPSRSGWWRGFHDATKDRYLDTADALRIGIGPTGARKVQTLELGGVGTNQHALVVGRTGSGKSTLLHTIITNLAMTYAPDEMQLYLVDFKKGVEFQSYARYQLPHAAVVAIESEREFGLSVLQGLKAEADRRGRLFTAKEAAQANLGNYRAKTGEKLPRILLLVDEFQVFFSEDDAIATQAAQLIDELVRQGRSFGIHLLLASQTLAGNYSLSRATIDQMGVRIALQCSEADSRLILADDNGAARLLSRPGEAIYNNTNGLVEGNNFFQVAYLRDEERDNHLQALADHAQTMNFRSARPQIVFEGNAPALLAKNQPLADLLTATQPPQPQRRVSAWLGDPIAIKDPTAAYFRRQSGSNLLMVGQNDELSLGMTMSALLSLATQYPADGAHFYVLDFAGVDEANADRLRDLARLLPQPVQWGRRRELAAIIEAVAAEVTRRQALDDEDLRRLPPYYLFVYGLQRARDLRPEESAGFSSFSYSDEPPPSPQPGAAIPPDHRAGAGFGRAYCGLVRYCRQPQPYARPTYSA